MQECRVIIEETPCSGAWNMAADEVMLQSALDRGWCTLRFYRWREPTLSLGYFQKPEEGRSDPHLRSLPMVRRLSGGGAILHHHEWTYSCALPIGHPAGRVPVLLYEAMHNAVIAWLRSHGVPAMLRGEFAPMPRGESGEETPGFGAASVESAGSVEERRAEAFLCFGRGDPRDVVLHGHKILGSAQRRRRGAILQHGSLLLRSSTYAPQFPGFLELSQQSELASELPEAISGPMSRILGEKTIEGIWTDEEKDSTNLCAANRYYSEFQNSN